VTRTPLLMFETLALGMFFSTLNTPACRIKEISVFLAQSGLYTISFSGR